MDQFLYSHTYYCTFVYCSGTVGFRSTLLVSNGALCYGCQKCTFDRHNVMCLSSIFSISHNHTPCFYLHFLFSRALTNTNTMCAFISPTPVYNRQDFPHSLRVNDKKRFLLPRHARPPMLHRSHLSIIALDSLFLSEDNVNTALDEVKIKLGSVFGNSAENRDIGITGDVQLVDLDGPVVVLRLKGRFWHKRSDVVSDRLLDNFLINNSVSDALTFFCSA